MNTKINESKWKDRINHTGPPYYIVNAAFPNLYLCLYVVHCTIIRACYIQIKRQGNNNNIMVLHVHYLSYSLLIYIFNYFFVGAPEYAQLNY